MLWGGWSFGVDSPAQVTGLRRREMHGPEVGGGELVVAQGDALPDFGEGEKAEVVGDEVAEEFVALPAQAARGQAETETWRETNGAGVLALLVNTAFVAQEVARVAGQPRALLVGEGEVLVGFGLRDRVEIDC